MNPNLPKRLLGLLFSTLLTISLQASAGEKAGNEHLRQTNAVLTVNTVKPQYRQWPRSRMASGGIHAWQEAVIAAETGGLRITALLVDVGSQVKRGQKLAQLSQQTVKVDIAQKQAIVAQARAELAEAEANAKRARESKNGNAFSEQQITQYLIARDKARASLAAAEAQLQSEQLRLQQTQVLAVDDGVITARSASLGAVVQTGTELFRLLRQNRLEWRAELMAEQLLEIHPGQKVTLTLANGEQLTGKVRMLAPTVNPDNRKSLVYVDLPASDKLRAGMFARGEIILGDKFALTVPESALVLRDGFAYVFSIDAERRVMQRKVITGRRANKLVEILDGLADDALIVASGGAFLNSGDTVRLAGNKAKAQ